MEPKGEKLAEHYSFYAVFQTPEEYRLIADGKELGTLPIANVLTPGALLIFSGRRLLVQEIHALERVIIVQPAKAGVPPRFGGDPGTIHDQVIKKMFDLFEGDLEPVYMDQTALEMLKEARKNYARMGFPSVPVIETSKDSHILATRRGTDKNCTLALALGAKGFKVAQHDGFLSVWTHEASHGLKQVLRDIALGEDVDLFAHSPNLVFEKFHEHLTPELLQQDACSCRLDLSSLKRTASMLVGTNLRESGTDPSLESSKH